jgi:hypothetical protein
VTCRFCAADPRPPHSDPRRCAFVAGSFTADNWQCGLLGRLRDGVGATVWNAGEQWALALPLSDDHYSEGANHVVLHGYKRRGAVEGCYTLHDEGMPTPTTLEEAMDALETQDGAL